MLKWERLRTGGLGSTSKNQKERAESEWQRLVGLQGSKIRNRNIWSHCLTKGAKAVCIRKTVHREESRQGPVEAF